MVWKAIAVVVGLVELFLPRQVARFWLNTCCENAEDVQLRRWVVTGIRLEGLVLLGWVLWHSRQELMDHAGPGDTIGEWYEEPEVTEVEEEPAEAEESPALQPDTTRFDIAAALYRGDEPLPVSALVERSEGTDWEVGRSTTSATLYRLHRDGLVDRRERDGARGYEYWLSDEGEAAVEAVEGTVSSEPSAAGE